MHTIYTAGYAGWTVPQLDAAMHAHAARLVDIRYRPFSRRPEWNAAALEQVFGSRYRCEVALGNVNYQNGPIRLAAPDRALARMQADLARQSVILLCACRDAAQCHRTDAADYLHAQLGNPVVHLPAPPKAASALLGGQIPAITLTQPWASLVAWGFKAIETRSWATSYRGPIAIHAAVTYGALGGKRAYLELCARKPFRTVLAAMAVSDPLTLPRGAVVATATLADCRQFAGDVVVDLGGRRLYELVFGDFTLGRYGWYLADVEALPTPIPAKGALGLWPWTKPMEVAHVSA